MFDVGTELCDPVAAKEHIVHMNVANGAGNMIIK